MPPSEVECIHPVRQSGYHVDVRKSSRSSQTSRAVKEKISSIQPAEQSRNLHAQLKSGNSISKSYVDVHHEGEQAPGDGLFPLKPLKTSKKQSFERKTKQDELVKHMSNLPQYLQRVERGANPQDKVLNFGVLDWGRLENWKYNQKAAPQSSIMYSPSTSNTSSPFSTVGSSTLSTRSDYGSIAHRKQSPTRGAHLASSSNDYHFTVLKPVRANPATLQDMVTVPKNSLVVQQKPPGTTVSCQRYQSKMISEKGVKNSINPKVVNEIGSSSSSSKGCEVMVPSKGKLREGDKQKKERLQESPFSAQQCPGRDKTIVLLLPKHLSNKRFPTPPRNRDYTGSKKAETGRISHSSGFCINESSELPSILQLSRTEPSKPSDLNTPRPTDALDSEVTSDVSDSSPHSGEMHTPERMQEEKKLNSTPADIVLLGCHKGSGLKADEPFSEPRSARCRIHSPNRRLSFNHLKVTSDVPDSSPHSGEMHTPEHMQEENKLKSTLADIVLIGRHKGSGLKADEPFSEPRSARCGIQSPNRRLSFNHLKVTSDVSDSSPHSGEMRTPERMQEENKLNTTPADLVLIERLEGLGLKAEEPFSEPRSARCGIQSPNPRGTFNHLKVTSDVSGSSQHSGEMHTPERMPEENTSNTTPADLVLIERLKGSGLKEEELFSEPRSARCGIQSPNRRLSFGKAKICRSLSFKEDSDLPQLSSTYVTTKSGPVESVACSDGLNRDKSTSNRRNRSSPLRRLLDPLLRPKTANNPTTVESLHDEARVCSSSDGRLPASVRPVKMNVNVSGSVPEDTNGACQDEKQGASMVQALLQVTVKNQLPWFTFAVDNNSDILAATMKKTSLTDKYDCSWIYTFYSFRKSKKKSGSWIGHGIKGRGTDYVPNIVGQMKVNGSRTQHDSRVPLTVREFVLFDVEPRKADEETPNLVPNVELAGIIIKVPIKTGGTLDNGKHKSGNHESLSNMKCSQNFIDGSFVGSQSLSSIVVVLPSGVHGLSSTGLPPPLLDRWRSGGSCDCGGWDVGCQLRVLSNEDQHTKNSDSTQLCGTQDNFDLFVKGGGSRETMPSLSFATFNKGVHSIDFNASLSSLQAFSICIAFLHCKNLAKVNNLFQELTAQDPSSMEPQRTKLCTPMEGNPTCCATFPPPSPVRRA